MGEVPGPEPEDNNRRIDNNNEEKLEAEIEAAKAQFLEVAKTEGSTSEIAISAVVIYHDLLQVAAESQEDRDRWLCTQILNTFIAANAVNPEYQEMVDSSREDLDMVQ